MKSTVLLIDDDPVDICALQRLLECWDLDVIAVRSGKEGLAKLAAVPVDLIVSDVRMPGMSGEDVVQAVKDTHPRLPVLLITAHADIKSAVGAMKLGAFDYIVKPPNEDEFRLAVTRAIEHSRLRRENQFFRAQLAAGGMYGERLIGRSPKMLEIFDLINRVARTDSTVLITGETGTGKELVAQTIHFKSRRVEHPLLALNCASVNPNLMESELFGHEKGSFTGAASLRRGRFEEADGGTLFLDEIGETAPEFQAKLLRVLQEGSFERLGGNKTIRVDVRLLASTNRDLTREVADGRFREDLFYRLRVIPVHVPPLREREDDIDLLAAHFVELYSRKYGGPAKAISRKALDELKSREWRGNVRELKHTIERAMVLADRETLEPDDFSPDPEIPVTASTGGSLQAILDVRTREYLAETLAKTGGHKQQAADILGIDRATLYRMLKRYGIGMKNTPGDF